jgi:hypothetical protein
MDDAKGAIADHQCKYFCFFLCTQVEQGVHNDLLVIIFC